MGVCGDGTRHDVEGFRCRLAYVERLPNYYLDCGGAAGCLVRRRRRTVIGAQGRNVHGGGTLFDKPTDVRNLYVAMSRVPG